VGSDAPLMPRIPALEPPAPSPPTKSIDRKGPGEGRRS